MATRHSGLVETVKFARYQELGELEFLSAHYVTHRFDPHMHAGFAIGVIVDGVEKFHYRGADHVAPSGTIVALNPQEVHTGGAGAEGGWTYRMLYPGPELLADAWAALTGRPAGTPYFPSVLIHDPELAAALARLQGAMQEADSALERQSSLLTILARLVARHAAPRAAPRGVGREAQPIARVRRYIEDHAEASPTLQDLCEIAGLSPYYLIRAFRRLVGLPPHAYLRQIRVDRAKGLLAKGVPVAEVAAATGFADQSHLTRQFKRIVGVPPGVFAKAIPFKTVVSPPS